MVWKSANKFMVFVRQFPTIQVHWEACDFHVWEWMEHSAHRVRHCRGGWCPIVDVISIAENLGFQFELTPEKAYLSCARIGMRKRVLRTAISLHFILDLQDVAWYMGQVHFRTPESKSFFSQHDQFEHSQVAVQQDAQQEGPWWLLGSWSCSTWTHSTSQGREAVLAWNAAVSSCANSKRTTSWWERRSRRASKEWQEGARWTRSGRAKLLTRPRMPTRFLMMLSKVHWSTG